MVELVLDHVVEADNIVNGPARLAVSEKLRQAQQRHFELPIVLFVELVLHLLHVALAKSLRGILRRECGQLDVPLVLKEHLALDVAEKDVEPGYVDVARIDRRGGFDDTPARSNDR